MGGSKKVFQKVTTGGVDFIQVAEKMMKRCEKDDFAMFVQLAHQIWLRQNGWIYEKVFTSPNDLVNMTYSYALEYKRANEQSNLLHNGNRNEQGGKWEAPTNGWYKANWDVALDSSSGRMGIGVIIRDDKGGVIAAMSKTREGLLEPTMGKL
jgi:hypothetical protein